VDQNATVTADPYRLPRTVAPDHYELAIVPDLRAFRFDGTSSVTLTVHEPVDEIVLNAIELEIHRATLEAADLTREGTVTLDPEKERATIVFEHTIPPGGAVLHLEFSGLINDQLHGFYRSTYTDDDGIEQVIATTQFEATDARRAFPCWDEPEHKATFATTLFVPDGLTALSNGGVRTERPADGGTWVSFETTMKMSTYLVAFVIGPLVATEPLDVDGVPLRVACTPGKEHLASFALEAGAHALRFLADYFAIPYPAGKLDLVALPDFAFGAMENVGCVTFRETALLVDRDNASHAELERVADVVAHEIAHMWFGDLVTMRWWNGIWLNEAFATFMEVTTSNAFRPEWMRWESFSVARGGAMVTDSLASTRPIEYEVVSPEEAEGMFDVLTYEKGGAVLRMLETYLGAERFRDGIRLYLDRHRYANTETTDLWDAIEEATGEPVRSVMDSWIFQGGHPEVAVERRGNELELTQRRFRYLPDPGDGAARWHIPVLLRPLREGPPDRLLLRDGSARVAIGPGPAVVNAGGWGVFRTRYAPELLSAILDDIGQLSGVERYNLVSDTWAAVLAGRTGVNDVLDLVGRLGEERDPNVWSAALGAVSVIHRYMVPASRSPLAAWMRGLLRPILTDLGWDRAAGEEDESAKLRALVVGALGTVGEDEDVRSRARALHDGLRVGATVPPDLLSPIVDILAWTGGEAEYAEFWDHIRQPATPQEEVRYLFRLAGFPHPGLLQRTLDATLGEIRSQNNAFVIGSALGSRWTGRTGWDWLAEHWDDVVKRVPSNGHRYMLEGMVWLTDAALRKEISAFLDAHPMPSARKQIAQYVERQEVNAAFVDRCGPDLTTRFGPSPE